MSVTGALAILVPSIASAYYSSIQRPCNASLVPYVTGAANEIRILAKRDSLTGMVTVAENTEVGFRYDALANQPNTQLMLLSDPDICDAITLC